SKILKNYNLSKIAMELNIKSGDAKKMLNELSDFKILHEKTHFYFNLISNFNVPFKQFSQIFKINIETYNYLKYFYKNNIDYENKIDKKFREYNEIAFYQELNIKEKEEYLKVNKLFFNEKTGDIIKLNFHDMFKSFITQNKNKIFHITDLEAAFIDFSAERNFIIEKGRKTIAKIERNENLIFSFKKKIRYYDYSLINEDILFSIENILINSKGLYSSKYFYDNNSFFKNELDIWNHYECHNLIKKYFNGLEDKNVYIKRMPNILIGYKNKIDFYKQLIFKFAPIKELDFYNYLSLEYGHEVNSLRANLPLLLSKYNVNNEYVVDFITLNDIQIRKILNYLSDNNMLQDIIPIDNI
ncbi:MAG: hypothetical protein ACRC63_02755, partial [Metamycoplasmataceae bacterium]